MNMIVLAEWLIWVLLLSITVLLSLGHYERAVRKGLTFNKATPIIIFFGWILLVFFLVFGFNKLHILWVYPLGVALIVFIMINQSAHHALKKLKDQRKID